MKACTAGSVITRQELGYKRCFWSMRIYEHLKRHGMSASTIAHGLGITSQAVSQTINGKRHSLRVLDALRAAGFAAVSLGARILRCETAATLCLGIHWWASQLPGRNAEHAES